MDHREAKRLMLMIQERGHKTAYLPETRAELDAWGMLGNAEAALGAMEVVPLGQDDKPSIFCCTTVSFGEVLSRADNKTCPCAWGCGRTVQHRPWAPESLPKICLYCAAEMPAEDN